MFADLVMVGLFVWPTTSFDLLFANFKLALGREKTTSGVDLDIGISLTLPVATVFSRHSDRSGEYDV